MSHKKDARLIWVKTIKLHEVVSSIIQPIMLHLLLVVLLLLFCFKNNQVSLKQDKKFMPGFNSLYG